MNFGETMRTARKRAGLTQEELAAAVETTKGAISRYESNQRIPRGDIFFRICCVLGFDGEEVLDFGQKFGLTRLQFELGLESINEWVCERQKADDGKNYSRKSRLLAAFDSLSEEGQRKAIERVEELAEVPKYRAAPPEEQKMPPPAG